jgi:hypothetical protein
MFGIAYHSGYFQYGHFSSFILSPGLLPLQNNNFIPNTDKQWSTAENKRTCYKGLIGKWDGENF